MQFINNETKNVDKKKLIIAGTVALVLLAAAVTLLVIVLSSGKMTIGVTALRCNSDQDVTPFDESVLYYDGLTLYCLNSKGNEKWHYTLGNDAKFHAGENYVVAWTGTKLVILDKNGKATYDNQMDEPIQFARAVRIQKRVHFSLTHSYTSKCIAQIGIIFNGFRVHFAINYFPGVHSLGSSARCVYMNKKKTPKKVFAFLGASCYRWSFRGLSNSKNRNQFCIYSFRCPLPDVIYCAHPSHLISCLEFFGDALLLLFLLHVLGLKW